MRIEAFGRQDWETLSEAAHLTVFKEKFDVSNERIDFALLAVSDDGKLLGYITCREHERETIYWQFGGTFPGTRETSVSWKAYQMGADWCKANGYKRVTTMIENENAVMLKFAAKIGFKIFGVRSYNNKVLVELMLEL